MGSKKQRDVLESNNVKDDKTEKLAEFIYLAETTTLVVSAVIRMLNSKKKSERLAARSILQQALTATDHKRRMAYFKSLVEG